MNKVNKKTNKELKEALKNEVAPLLIGLRNEIKETNSALKEIAGKQVPVNELEIVMDGNKVTALKGKDGSTPIKDVDYLSREKTEEIIREAIPKKGKDYFTKKEIKEIVKLATPVKGVDYVDGKDGNTPEINIEKISKDILEKATPIKGIHYNDGVTTVIEKQAEKITGEFVRNLLESLKGKQRLSVKAIRDIEDLIKKVVLENIQHHISSIGGSGGESSGGGGHTIKDEGTPLTQRTGLNFIGSGVTVTDNAGSNSTDVTISGGAGSPAGSNTQVQFNNSGSFGASSNFVFNDTGDFLTTGSYTANVGGGGSEYFVARNTASATVGNESSITFKNLKQDAIEATMGKISLLITEDGLDEDGSDLVFYTYSNPSLGEGLRISRSQRVGISGTDPSAYLHLRAGTTTAGFAPLKFNSGSLLSFAEDGAVEFLTDKLYLTILTGTSRKEITLNDTALTSGSVPVATTNGRLTTYDSFTFNGSTDRLFLNSEYGASTTGAFNLSNTSAGDTVNQTIQAFGFNDSSMGFQDFAHIIGQSLGITPGDVDGGLKFRLRVGGVFQDILSLDATTALATFSNVGVVAPTLTATTSVTSPLITGGTGTTQDLTFKTTSGVGATGADMHFQVGNNGATEAMTILNNGNVGIQSTAILAPLTLGSNNVNNSVDAVVLISRAVDTTIAGNGHAFSDSSTLTRTGTIGYNSYDGRITVSVGLDHYAAFQAIPIFTSGTTTNYYGLYAGATHTGGTITNWYGVYTGAATSGSGSVGTMNGVYIATPSEVPTTDYGLRIAARSAASSAHDIWLESNGARISMGASRDLILTRDSAYTLQLWIDTASPLTSTIQGNGAVGTNITGAAFQVGGGQGTGTGAGGPINFRVAPAGSTGASQNAYVTAATITSTSRMGIATTAPDKVLEVNLGTSDAFRLTYNDANGSAATYMDTTVSSTGLTTFTAAGSAKGFVFSDPIRPKGYTVATLPAGVQGDRAFVTDALAPAFLVTVAGGGSAYTPVSYSGSAWVCG